LGNHVIRVDQPDHLRHEVNVTEPVEENVPSTQPSPHFRDTGRSPGFVGFRWANQRDKVREEEDAYVQSMHTSASACAADDAEAGDDAGEDWEPLENAAEEEELSRVQASCKSLEEKLAQADAVASANRKHKELLEERLQRAELLDLSKKEKDILLEKLRRAVAMAETIKKDKEILEETLATMALAHLQEREELEKKVETLQMDIEKLLTSLAAAQALNISSAYGFNGFSPRSERSDDERPFAYAP
jgi:hypothetical protein